ncbi:MAG: ABC transporter substrate-binding protein, partial [Deltaproteobacteria bacterium]
MKRTSQMTRVIVFCLGLVLISGEALAQDQPIKLGVMFIMSGPMGGYGKHGKQAVQFAIDEINAQGGILGRKVEALFEDTKLQVPVATEIAKRFILGEKVDFIIGPTSSGVAVALSKIAAEHKKILVL